jgi:hypothetical protein
MYNQIANYFWSSYLPPANDVTTVIMDVDKLNHC